MNGYGGINIIITQLVELQLSSFGLVIIAVFEILKGLIQIRLFMR